MGTNRVENTNFLNNKTKIKDGDYVFIKPINIRNNLYYLQYKDFKNKIDSFTYVETKSPQPNSKEAVSIFEIFTLDETKYKNQCKSNTQPPFSFDEVAKDKGFYSIEKGKKGEIKGIFKKKIDTMTGNVYVTFNEGIVSNVVEVPKPKPNFVLKNPIGKTQSDYPTLNNTFIGNTLALAGDPDDENTKKFEDLLKKYDTNDMDKQKILKNFKKLEFIHKAIFINLFKNPKYDNYDGQNIEERKKSILKDLEDGFNNEETFMKKVQQLGGKATRRRKRKGKKRSKNTRKKRKSKKQRRQ